MVDERYLSDNDTLEQRIDKIIEEAAEVIQIALKMKRFGPFSYHPDDEKKTDNFTLLGNEVEDVIYAWDRIKDKVKSINKPKIDSDNIKSFGTIV